MPSTFTVAANDHLIRSQLWSKDLKDILMDDLMAMRFVRVLTDFPDGLVLNIPTLGEAETSDFAEGQAIKYNRMDTGNFQFSFDQYKYSATSISEKFKRDSYYTNEVISSFLPKQRRALMEAVETRILSRGNSAQTASDLNVINTAPHRFVASGTNQRLVAADFAKASYALQKANVPLVNLVAIVDPSVAYTIQTDPNVTNYLSPMPMWEKVVKDGMVTGTRFMFNLYGFDVYVSNYLPQGIAETINARSVTTGVANMSFSAAPGSDLTPFVGGFRQQPTVQSEFNKDLQQTEYLTIAEYGFKLWREENMVTILSDTGSLF